MDTQSTDLVTPGATLTNATHPNDTRVDAWNLSSIGQVYQIQSSATVGYINSVLDVDIYYVPNTVGTKGTIDNDRWIYIASNGSLGISIGYYGDGIVGFSHELAQAYGQDDPYYDFIQKYTSPSIYLDPIYLSNESFYLDNSGSLSRSGDNWLIFEANRKTGVKYAVATTPSLALAAFSGQGATSEQPYSSGTGNSSPVGTTANDVILTGVHTQYVVTATSDGRAYIKDTVVGRDGTRTIANPGELRFRDGIGIFDATGNVEAVTRLYQAAFNRAPDAPGIEYSTALINAGSISLAKVADGFITSDEFNRAYGNPDTRTFVTLLYRNVLHRAISSSDPLDVQGVKNFSNLADSQGRGAALLAISDSQENHRQTLPISGDRIDAQTTRLYQAAFNRAPDAPGFDVMQNALRSGLSAETLAESFVASGEFQRAHGTLSNRDFAAQLYRNVLHREADQSGLDQYTRALDSNYTRGFVLASIADSTENRILTAGVTHDAWVFISGQ